MTSAGLGLDAVTKIRLHGCIWLLPMAQDLPLVSLADVHLRRAACLSN